MENKRLFVEGTITTIVLVGVVLIAARIIGIEFWRVLAALNGALLFVTVSIFLIIAIPIVAIVKLSKEKKNEEKEESEDDTH